MDVVVKEWDVPQVMEIIREAALTGSVGDGKIFVHNAAEAMRIRTGERGCRRSDPERLESPAAARQE